MNSRVVPRLETDRTILQERKWGSPNIFITTFYCKRNWCRRSKIIIVSILRHVRLSLSMCHWSDFVPKKIKWILSCWHFRVEKSIKLPCIYQVLPKWIHIYIYMFVSAFTWIGDFFRILGIHIFQVMASLLNLLRFTAAVVDNTLRVRQFGVSTLY